MKCIFFFFLFSQTTITQFWFKNAICADKTCLFVKKKKLFHWLFFFKLMCDCLVGIIKFSQLFLLRNYNLRQCSITSFRLLDFISETVTPKIQQNWTSKIAYFLSNLVEGKFFFVGQHQYCIAGFHAKWNANSLVKNEYFFLKRFLRITLIFMRKCACYLFQCKKCKKRKKAKCIQSNW